VTLGIGWAVWSLIVWRNGQTPAKQLLGTTVVVETIRKAAGWWRMLWRELVLKSAVGTIPSLLVFTAAPRAYWWLALPLTIALYCWLLWDPFRQQLWDKLAGTLVVDDPFHQLEGGPGPRIPAQLAWQADLIAEIAQRGLERGPKRQPHVVVTLTVY